MAAYSPPKIKPEIIYEDDVIVVVSKPAGLLSVPGKGDHLQDCMESRLRDVYSEIFTIHRLDMDTSGLMVFARNKQAQAHIGKQFEQRKVRKTYIANVWGKPDQVQGLIDLPLRCDWPNRPRQMVCYEHGKPAQTEWTVIGTHEFGAQIELTPLTGRSHQLRVHMMALGHPILGDPFYAPNDAKTCVSRLHLHAKSLSFVHPETDKSLKIDDRIENTGFLDAV